MISIKQTDEFQFHNPYFAKSSDPLAPLPYPLYFVTKDPKWQDLMQNPDQVFDDSIYERCTRGHDLWSAQAFIDLKRRGLDVYLVSKPIPGKICVIPYYYLSPKDWLFKSYVVACQHDTPHPKLCNRRIVMNHLRVLDSTHHFLPHRPQPCLRPRDLSRRATLENLVFKGHAYNLAEPFRSPEFQAKLEAIGIRLLMGTEGSETTFADWANYTEADVVMAVRNNTLYDISLKPALKLINAWFAGCPAILSPEPAYREIRQSELDYIEVRTPEEAIAALKHLKENPTLYLAMIENGFQRARDYTADGIMQQWRDLFAGPITEDYQRWLKASLLQKHVVRPLRYFWQIIDHKLAFREYQRNIHHGQRILQN